MLKKRSWVEDTINNDVPVPGAFPVLAPAMGDRALSLDQFLAQGESFLMGNLDAALFLDMCGIALENLEDHEGEVEVYKFRYLAYIALERYYEAMADSFMVLNRFGDEALHYQMMFSLHMKRANYYKALDCVEHLIEIARENDLDASELEENRADLGRYMLRIQFFTPEDFWDTVSPAPQVALIRYRSTPILLSGKARMVLQAGTGIPYLVFVVRDKQQIFCQIPKSEIPFLNGLGSESDVTVLGSLLNADGAKIVLQPCNLLD